jgi:hypothetical protein
MDQFYIYTDMASQKFASLPQSLAAEAWKMRRWIQQYLCIKVMDGYGSPPVFFWYKNMVIHHHMVISYGKVNNVG